MKAKTYVTLLLIMLLFRCATIKTEYVDPHGRQLPDPHYVLKAVGMPILVTFYYTAYEEVKDLDGTIVSKPVFLDSLTYQNLSAKKYKALTLTIEVRNPQEIEYSFYEQIKYDEADTGKVIHKGGRIKRSNLSYRQIVYHLPCEDGYRSVDQVVIMEVDNHEIMRIGHFRYDLYQSKGGERDSG